MVLNEVNSCLINKDMNELRELNTIICAITEFINGFLSSIIAVAVKDINTAEQHHLNVYL